MITKLIKLLFLAVLCTGLITFSPLDINAQSRVETAIRRSQNAARTIQVITAMPEEETIPPELLKRARAIGVFPDVVKMGMFFSEGMKGYGVICNRIENSWTLPAYYSFASSQFNISLQFKSFDLVVLFVDEEAVKAFQSGRVDLKGLLTGVPGPVGKMTREKENSIRMASVIVYGLLDGKLRGLTVESDILNGAVINPDNNVNNSVYGVKGREIFKGIQPKTAPPVGVNSFSTTLNQTIPIKVSDMH